MRITWTALILAAVIGCGSESDGGPGGGSGTIDAGPGGGGADAKGADAPGTTVTEVTVSGRTTQRDQTGEKAVAGVTVQAFRSADESTPVATATSDAQGDYTLTIELTGEAFVGYFKASKTNFQNTYLFPPIPVEMDFGMASLLMITADTYTTLHEVAEADPAKAGSGLIILVVTDGTNAVSGAKATSTPAPTPPETRYSAKFGNQTFPSPMPKVTAADGVGYLFNLPAGQVMLSASKTGSTFASHSVKVWADSLTTTVIVP